MATEQCPPQEELEFKLRGDKPLFQGIIAPPGDITSKWFRDNAYCDSTMAIRVCMDSPFGPDIVYTHCEVTDPNTRLGLLVGGIQKGTEEYKPLAIDDEGRLCVDAKIDIENANFDVQLTHLDNSPQAGDLHDSIRIGNGANLMAVDSDLNAHVEIHGNDEGGIDRVVITSERGNIALDGQYDGTDNTNPSSTGLIAHDRDAAHNRTTLDKRVTAVEGEAEVVALDVSLHDEEGDPYDATNPLPVTQTLPTIQAVKYRTVDLLNAGSNDMTVDGSGVAVPFSQAPAAGEEWYVEKIVVELRDDGSAKLDEFGSGPGLTNGILIEVQSKGNVVMSFPINENQDLMSAADLIFEVTQFQGAPIIIYTVRFNKELVLNGDDGDFMRFTVRDNLTNIEGLQSSLKAWEAL